MVSPAWAKSVQARSSPEEAPVVVGTQYAMEGGSSKPPSSQFFSSSLQAFFWGGGSNLLLCEDRR